MSKFQIRRGFTLIELLVVIAIIAILAAILFPVFAQAKVAAKKAAAISNVKQSGTSMIIYTGDYDDQLPHSLIRASSGVWQFNLLAEVPVDWRLVTPATHERHSIYWANAIQPYMKNRELLELKEGSKPTFATPQPGKKPAMIGMNYNGLLNTYSMTAVNQPSSVPMLWYGIGNANRAGQDLPVPQLRCSGNSACVFNPSGSPDDSNGNPGSAWFLPANTTTHRVYGTGTVFTYTDTSTKFRRIGRDGGGSIPSTAAMSDPFASYDAGNKATGYWPCTLAGAPATAVPYWCYFRPDQER